MSTGAFSISTLPRISVLKHPPALVGKSWTLGNIQYRFMEKRKGGFPGYCTGGEGVAFPLLNAQEQVVAYLKLFTELGLKRYERTKWLIDRAVYSWEPGLKGAPNLWTDTRSGSRPDGVDFDFAGSLAKAVPGREWREFKDELVASPPDHWADVLRWQCCFELIRSLAVLEREGVVHGDLSDCNIIVDVNIRPAHEQALYLIDFDAFVSPLAGGGLGVLTKGEKGTFGTPGYRPPQLEERSEDDSVAPFSDRYGRDMLLLELLLVHLGFSSEKPPAQWSRGELKAKFLDLRHAYRKQETVAQFLDYLEPDRAFVSTEENRLSSNALAELLNLSPSGMPVPGIAPRPVTVPVIAIPARTTGQRDEETILSSVRRVFEFEDVDSWIKRSTAIGVIVGAVVGTIIGIIDWGGKGGTLAGKGGMIVGVMGYLIGGILGATTFVIPGAISGLVIIAPCVFAIALNCHAIRSIPARLNSDTGLEIAVRVGWIIGPIVGIAIGGFVYARKAWEFAGMFGVVLGGAFGAIVGIIPGVLAGTVLGLLVGGIVWKAFRQKPEIGLPPFAKSMIMCLAILMGICGAGIGVFVTTSWNRGIAKEMELPVLETPTSATSPKTR